MATSSAPGQRAMFQMSATVEPSPMKPSRSSAKAPPTKTITRLTSTRTISTMVDAMSSALRWRKLRPPSTSKTTLRARRAASSAPVVP